MFRVTIQGLANSGRPSFLAMKTQGVRHLFSAGSSLEIHDITSRGLETEPPPQLSAAWMWPASDSPSPVKQDADVGEAKQHNQKWLIAAAKGKKERQPYLTSPRLGVGHINKPVHHLACLLDLRSGAVNRATWLISSIKGKKFIAGALLLHSGSLPLRSARKTDVVCIFAHSGKKFWHLEPMRSALKMLTC